MSSHTKTETTGSQTVMMWEDGAATVLHERQESGLLSQDSIVDQARQPSAASFSVNHAVTASHSVIRDACLPYSCYFLIILPTPKTFLSC